MTIRRFFALTLFLCSAYFLVHGVQLYRGDSGGYRAMVGLIVICSALVGVLLAAGIARGHRGRSFAEDSTFGLVPDKAKVSVASGVAALSGLAMWFIALRGIVRNQMVGVGSNAVDVTFGSAPGKFVAYLLFWLIAGCACLWLARFLARPSK